MSTTDKLFKSVTVLGQPFALTNIEGFPYTEYTKLQATYLELESWFNGEALKEEQVMADKSIELYPLRLNPIRIAAMKHAYALFGEFTDDISGPLAQPKVVLRDAKDKAKADTIEDAIGSVMYDNNMSALMMENGVLSQVYGGCIFKVSWVPESAERPIRIELINPKEFIGYPKGIDYWSFREVWVVRPIDESEAAAQGIKAANSTMYYIEHWTETEYTISINDTPVLYDKQPENSKTMANQLGFVPFVYIPHQRAGKFYGDSLITEAAIGLTKELNLRTADAGDATSDQSHSILVAKNLRGTPQIVKMTNGLNVVMLPPNQSITGTESDPDLTSVTRSNITEAMIVLNREIRADIRRELFIPPVAEGEDEGSQRSAATLVLRMWPLTTHVKSERVYWTTGLTVLCKMIMKIMASKNLRGITKDMLAETIKIKWAPILPRDRQAYVEEMIGRAGVNLGSPEHLLSLIGDVEDIDLVMGQIKDWVKYLEDIKAEAAQKAFDVRLQSQEEANGSQGDSRGQGETQRDG